MKSYSQQNYPCSIKVRIRFDNGTLMVDYIKGLNPGHALWLAWQNWPAAIVINELPVRRLSAQG